MKKNGFKRSPVYGHRRTVRGVAMATTREQIVLWQNNKFQGNFMVTPCINNTEPSFITN